MSRLILSILHLPAFIEETPERHMVTLEYNKKDQRMMEVLQRALAKINKLSTVTLSGKVVEFKVGEIDSHLNAINK